ncbi:family 2 glycosyl transferase [Roseovarius atlanticus]|nr:family 2 glycosyl transferase [Roseovarius atlanticus]MBY6123280.1 family 2 glycosyl transferase [Roseovarius atlanticus]MBY6147775.1 family 2 glycosyl transferase [Roseovarius atlanticus]
MFTSQSEARVAIIVASKGRSDVLQGLVPFINRQTLKPAKLVFAVTSPADADFDLETLLDPAISGEVVISAAGACKQRNRALDRLGDDIDFCVFYDDDFYPSRHALSELVRGFEFHEDVDGITGTLVADGINGPGLSPQEAAAMLSDWDTAFHPDAHAPPRIVRDTLGLYGCNMAIRSRAAHGLRFDEVLPAYGWQEDVDFGARLPGRCVQIENFTGVHLGTKAGRESRGELLGYSQVVNLHYLWRKGTITAGHALNLVLRNMVANHVKALRPEPWIDRAGRMRGNWRGLCDVLLGRAAPGRIDSL